MNVSKSRHTYAYAVQLTKDEHLYYRTLTKLSTLKSLLIARMSFDKTSPKWYLHYKVTSFALRGKKIRQNDDTYVVICIVHIISNYQANLVITINLNYPIPISIADKSNTNIFWQIWKIYRIRW